MNEFLDQLSDMRSEEFWTRFLRQNAARGTTETTQTTERTTQTTNMSSVCSELKSPKVAFSSSAFFDPTAHPTIEDQVFLSREIAKQLVCDETNAKSKGREMYKQRVEKSYKWVTTATTDDGEDDTGGDANDDHSNTISDGPPNLRLLLDPRHVQDLNSLSFESNETEIMREEKRTRDFCEGIVADLTSPEVNPNKGNVLFAKRQQLSDEWVVEATAGRQTDDGRDDEQQWRPTSVALKTTDDRTMSGTTLERHFWDDSTSIARKFRDFNSRAKPFSRSQ
ncbi:unnamed protein product [Oppiella nova]|uniref:Uncharacterized protein n=1 Tax=Oppiella nova TaxID=334625 RepID=A0A7R9M3N5_9ACAR|nr:unnamed protein product [Oppiella nova]CAG2169970.1 unnamed protein product [Oppiella nova]